MDPNQYYGYDTPTYVAQDTAEAKRKRLLIGGGGLLVFFTFLIIVVSMIFSSPSIRPDVARITAMHYEIVRVAEIGMESDDARRATQVMATNVHSVALTNTAQLALWANSNFADEFTSNTLASQMNEQTDATLAKASETNEFDETFVDGMAALIDGANKEIATNYSKFDGQKELQNILDQVVESNTALLDHVTSLQ